jgi:5-formyltetrahydrofolate cyclo-ligase
MNKPLIRQEYIALRQQLTPEEWAHRNTLIFKHLISNWPNKLSLIHTFLPMVQHREPDTWRLIDFLQAHHPSVEICVPKINPKTDTLVHGHYTSRAALLPGKWGILEPDVSQPVPPQRIDLVVVPMLVGDKRGYRVGYGKGYYDKFLAECRPDTLKWGLSLFPLKDALPAEPHDIPLDAIITPEGFFQIGG